METYTDYWVVVGTAGPVIFLATIVSFATATMGSRSSKLSLRLVNLGGTLLLTIALLTSFGATALALLQLKGDVHGNRDSAFNCLVAAMLCLAAGTFWTATIAWIASQEGPLVNRSNTSVH